jgi:FAS-associated factor 2
MRKGWKNTNGRRMLMPRDTAARFRREFEEEYGQHRLAFFDGGHAQALDAAKRELKFLLIVLMSPEHDDTESFIRETLLSDEVVGFVSNPANNMIVWAGNVLDSEAYQVSLEYSCTKFPFSALICLTPREGSTRMGIVKRLTGPMNAETYLDGIQAAINKYSPELDGVRAERAAQEVARNLRTEQDSAYERSLARDRERARQRREAEAAAAAAEKKALDDAAAAERHEENRQQWRRWRAKTVAPETDAKDAVRLALNMPEAYGGGRVIRRFASDTTLEELYAFVECYELLGKSDGDDEDYEPPDDYHHKYGFRIASVMPRETFQPSKDMTIAQKMGRGGTLIVEESAQDSDNEEQ